MSQSQEKKPEKKFQRREEDFLCEHCGATMVGNGYTNHCAQCLWSKHVDIAPGDRLADCGGLMEPIALRQEGTGYVLTHCCQKCGHEKKNKGAAEDDFEAMLALSRRLANAE
ncbi:MAG: RNHCP domain-containing protein [Candidatus Moraniibacteriota bacterium]